MATTATTTKLWRLLDEDHVSWKEFVRTLRELTLSDETPLNEAILHSVVDRDPPPKYLRQLLELRKQDLLRDEETVIYQRRVWCLPLEIAAILSSTPVFHEVLVATKLASQSPDARTALLFGGTSIEKISPERLSLVLKQFPKITSLELSCLDSLLCRHESLPWSWVRSILENHSCRDVTTKQDDQPIDLAVSFFQLVAYCSGHVRFAAHNVLKIPKFLRYIITQNPVVDPSILHVAIDIMIPMHSEGHHPKRMVKDVLEIITQACPESARYRDVKRLPLHVAAHSSLEGSHHIWNAYPAALGMRCPSTRLYPFQMAALANTGSSIELSWTFLRAAPDLVRTNPDHTWSTMDLKLAKHEMNIARTRRKFHEQIKSLKEARNEVLMKLETERRHLVLELDKVEPKPRIKRRACEVNENDFVHVSKRRES
jgi:hypothetical protein